ncbi:MAG TPA: transposase [Hyphomicrobium zavarzinii]|nr:transposase [Hyphomicrobium zavarzinii]
MSVFDHRLQPEGGVRRFEVIKGAIGRRRWTTDERARILEETLVPGTNISAVARRHGLTPQQLFTWRREARKETEAMQAFVPAVIVEAPPESLSSPAPLRRRGRPRRGASIEIDFTGARVTIENGASPATIAAVLGALKAGS